MHNTPKVTSDEYEPSIDFNDAPKLPIINNVVECATQTSNDKRLCSKLFIKKDYFENFYNILNLNTIISQKLMVKPNKLKIKMIMKAKFLKIRLNT